MKTTGKFRRRVGVIAASAAVLVTGGAALSLAATSAPPSNGTSVGHGINEFGSTVGFYKGHGVRFNYSRGFYCDTSVSSAASTGCEAGAQWKKAPSPQHDPLYVTVPLGFSVPRSHIHCPSNLVCVDHGGTIDLSRLEPALKPLFPSLTDAQLTDALKNYALPEHDHFVTDLNNRKPEWWDVRVIGVLSPKTMAAIRAHGSYGYIASLIKKGDKTVVGPIPTNEFLYFRAF
ncbi:MAG: hypothetical protein ACTHMS_06400 [Jatrophihabitans sp.]|uniref:hypothetical protein n=1 Tax=Jatrophihabitans sp. TaxID=1932789 RepID=UPI003F7F48B2